MCAADASPLTSNSSCPSGTSSASYTSRRSTHGCLCAVLECCCKAKFCRYGATSLLRDGLRVVTQVSIYGAVFRPLCLIVW
jgi:hypothetical protein